MFSFDSTIMLVIFTKVAYIRVTRSPVIFTSGHTRGLSQINENQNVW